MKYMNLKRFDARRIKYLVHQICTKKFMDHNWKDHAVRIV